jgi:hypothetical protein
MIKALRSLTGLGLPVRKIVLNSGRDGIDGRIIVFW